MYGACFQCEEDQALVRELVNAHLPIPAYFSGQDVDERTIDDSVSGFVRIGAVYMRTGGYVAEGDASVESLVHTESTVAQLSMLAAASQSKRPVLLEGECAGKTALVRELARLTQRRLVLISMNESMETSDLIGQWLPSSSAAASTGMSVSEMFSKWHGMSEGAVKFLLTWVIPLIRSPEDLKEVTVLVQGAAQALVHAGCRDRRAEQMDSLDAAVCDLVTACNCALWATFQSDDAKLCDRIKSECGSAKRRLELVLPHIRALAEVQSEDGADSGSAPADVDRPTKSFVFVESLLVKALSSGDWVLLDNANSCPPEVLERLNSLLEQDRVLNLYECGEGKEYSDAANTIHTDFRVFATANTKRAHSNKLSAAFLNRMVRIWLPDVDTSPHLYDIVLRDFAGVYGGRELAKVAVSFHHAVTEMELKKELTFISGYSITFRSLKYACRTMRYLIREKRVPPFFALAWGLVRTYSSCLSVGQQRAMLMDRLCRVLREERAVWQQAGTTFPPVRSVVSARRALDVDVELVSRNAGNLERVLVQTTAALLREVVVVIAHRADDKLGDAVVQFLRTVCLALSPGDVTTQRMLATVLDRAQPAVDVVTGRDFSALCSADTALDVVVSCSVEGSGLLQQALVPLLTNASFSDAKERHALLQRVELCLSPFVAMMEHEVFRLSDPVLQSSVRVKRALRQVIRDGCVPRAFLLPLCHDTVGRQWKELDDSLNRVDERSAAWAFKREMCAPVCLSHRRIEAILRFLVRHVDTDTLTLLHSFGYMLLWLAAAWRVELAILRSNAFASQGDVDSSDVPVVVDTELLSTSSGLTTASADSIGDRRQQPVTIEVLEELDMEFRALECLPGVFGAVERAVHLLEARVSTDEVNAAADQLTNIRSALNLAESR